MYKVVEKKLERMLDEMWTPIDYTEIPSVDAEDYAERMHRLWKKTDCSAVIIYADREHFSNMYYFTGYDPRFEEALLVLCRDRKPQIIVGNEGAGYVKRIPYDIDVHLYQTFSLMGQPNDDSLCLEELLKKCDLPSAGEIGLIGWKYYEKELHSIDGLISDIPYYIIRTLETVVGSSRMKNITDLLSDCETGLKHSVAAKEIIQFEALGTKISRNVYNSIKNLHTGVSEVEASKFLAIDGEPICTHPIFSFGDEHVRLGLSSCAYDKRLELGDLVSIGYGLRGSLVHRCGIYAFNEDSVPLEKKAYEEELVKPYFATVVRWYEMMRIGCKCGDIWQMIDRWIGFKKFNITLNPGHLSHTDEWTDSPFYKDSKVRIQSGMIFQCDYTVSFEAPYMSCHVEDGLAIADEKMRREIAQMAPRCWERIQSRRKMMREVLNIDISEEVLPLSDLAAVCFPYFADLTIVLAKD